MIECNRCIRQRKRFHVTFDDGFLLISMDLKKKKITNVMAFRKKNYSSVIYRFRTIKTLVFIQLSNCLCQKNRFI